MTAITRLTLLGTGSSGGVPRANGDWGACDPSNPKNRRRRCAALIEYAASESDLADGEAVTRVVIDTSPDFREQMLSAGVRRIDGVVMTHDHADQTHGIDDLRAFAYLQRQRIPVWMDKPTADSLSNRFSYTFQAPPGSGYPPILDLKAMPACGDTLSIEGPGGPIAIIPFDQEHGRIRSLGFRIGELAYSADINRLPDESADILSGIRCWVVDALRDEPHPTHFNIDDALAAIDRVSVPEAVLTNLHITLDHGALAERLPDGVRPAHDGLVIEARNGSVSIRG